MPYLHISASAPHHTFVVCTSFWNGSDIFKLLHVVATRFIHLYLFLSLCVCHSTDHQHQHHLSPLVVSPTENVYSNILNNVPNKILFASSLCAAESDQALKSQNAATKLQCVYTLGRMCCSVCHVHGAIIEHSAIEYICIYIVATTTMKTTATSAIGQQQLQQRRRWWRWFYIESVSFPRLLVNNLILSFSMPY